MAKTYRAERTDDANVFRPKRDKRLRRYERHTQRALLSRASDWSDEFDKHMT